MNHRSLENFVKKAREAWGPLSSQGVSRIRGLMEELSLDLEAETWIASLLAPSAAAFELYRDPDFGFVLSAYIEDPGKYRAPHDHGSGWVVYAVQSGAMEMGTFGRHIDPQGKLHLVTRERFTMRPGDSRVFLPTDIHDTRCLSSKATILRFTSCDLKKEDTEGRMIRYPSEEEVQS